MPEPLTAAQRQHLAELENKRTNTHREDEWRDIAAAMCRSGAESILLRRVGEPGHGAALDEIRIFGDVLDRHASNVRELHSALGDTAKYNDTGSLAGRDMMIVASARLRSMQREIERLEREVKRLDGLSDDLMRSKQEAMASHQEARDRALRAEKKVKILRCAVRELVDQAEDVGPASGA